MSPSKWARSLTFCASMLQCVSALLNATETSSVLSISNERLYAAVDKKTGVMSTLTLDGQNLLGTRSGSVGIGPYLDCYCSRDYLMPSQVSSKTTANRFSRLISPVRCLDTRHHKHILPAILRHRLDRKQVWRH